MEPSGKVIRSLREALHMSQAEFAKASGWSVSTISSWERGRATPSRLAFKTILAFAEAHGVRYQPTSETPGGTTDLPVLRLSSRLPAPTVEVLDVTPAVAAPSVAVPVREESLGSRRWTAIAADGLMAPSTESRLAVTAVRAGWRAEANFRLAVGRRTAPRRRGYLAAAAALLVGIGVGTLIHTSNAPERAPATARDLETRPERVPAAPVAVVPPHDLAPDIEAEEIPIAVPAEFPGPAAAADAAPDDAAAAPPTFTDSPDLQLARLESIVSLDGIRRASFRVGDRSITLVEGDQLGGKAIALIGNEDVTLVGAGEATRVRLGFETPLD